MYIHIIYIYIYIYIYTIHIVCIMYMYNTHIHKERVCQLFPLAQTQEAKRRKRSGLGVIGPAYIEALKACYWRRVQLN